ncbi:MAG: DUF1559 domain-containing protein [Planctomycetales bacterium]|nr:DUF1559 domain-containing protein [Planctomycetales bacterium]
MNSIGLSILWATLQITLLGTVTSVLYLLTRRLSARLAASALFCGLSLMAATVILTFAPVPAWTSLFANIVDRAPSGARSPDSQDGNMLESVHPVDHSATDFVAILREAWLAELERANVDNSLATTTAAKNSQTRWQLRWYGMFGNLSLAAVCLGVSRLVLGLVVARRYKRSSELLDDSEATEILDVLQAKLGYRRRIELRVHSGLETAATIGSFCPVILLPRTWQDWTVQDLRSVLAHELAHIHHQDFMSWVFAQVFVAIQFFHPLSHWLAGRLRLEQELAADAVAAELTGGPTAYLTSLAGLALRQEQTRLSWSAQAFLPTRRSFLRRIEMLRSKRKQSNRGQQLRPVVVGFLLVAGLAVVGWRQPALIPLATPVVAAEQAVSTQARKRSSITLEFVPSDAFAVIAVRPSELMSNSNLSEIANMLTQDTSAGGETIDFRNVDFIRLVFFSTDPLRQTSPDGDAMMIRFHDAKSVLSKFEPNSNPIAGRQVGKLFFQHATKLDANTVLLSNSEGGLARALTSRTAEKEPWTSGWAKGSDKTAAACINVAGIRRSVEGQEHQAAELGAILRMLGPVWSKSKHLNAAVSVTDGLTLELDLASDDAEAADGSLETVKSLITLGKNSLAGFEAMMDKRGANQRAAVTPLIKLGHTLLANVNVTAVDDQVHARLVANENSVAQLAKSALPSAVAARAAARRAQDINAAKHIILAMYNYESTNGHFPAAQVVGPDGKTVHSWRVAILPYLEQNELYERYKLDEPWDSDHNKKLIAEIPPVYRSAFSPKTSTNSDFFVFTGKEAPFDGTVARKVAEIADGTSNTLFVIATNRDIPWTKPDDIPFDPAKALPDLSGPNPEGNVIARGDGSVVFLSNDISKDRVKKMITYQGGEDLN